MALSMTQLIEKVGNENIQFQNLVQSMEGIQTRKGGDSAVTFITGHDKISPDSVMREDGQWVGLVVWLPKDRVDAVLKEQT